jgi:hypothetical protein
MRLCILHVRLACSRKGSPSYTGPPEVRVSTARHLRGLVTPYSLLAADSHALYRTYLIVTVAGVYGLFPLLFTPAGAVYTSKCRIYYIDSASETFIKIAYSLVWGLLCLGPLNRRTYE